MHVRPIAAHEIQAFVSINTDTAQSESTRQYLNLMIANDDARFEWCFVIEDGGQLLGRVAFWKLTKVDKPSDLILLDVPWERDDYLTIGSGLLCEVFAAARSLGADHMGYVLDSPPAAPQWQYFLDQRIHLLEELGFVLERETYRFKLNTENMNIDFPTGLIFKGLPEVGEAAFIDALMRVSSQTFDQRIQHDRERLGAEGEAHQMLEDLRQMDYQPEWWQLAYTSDATLVGLVMPTLGTNFSTIGYIGVLPEQRGHGYIHLLLQQGTAILHKAGAHHMSNDTDLNNAPMAAAFRRAGYTQFGTRREYNLKL